MRNKRVKFFILAAAVVALGAAAALYVIPIARHRSQNVTQGTRLFELA